MAREPFFPYLLICGVYMETREVYSMSVRVLGVLLFGAILAGCSKPTAEEYFKRAQEAQLTAQKGADTVQNAQEMMKLFEPAIKNYTSLITDYPASELAETALFSIATIRTNGTREPQAAIDSYRRYVELYPTGKQASVSMFMIGYLYNNELHNLDSAAAAYKRFLAAHPGDEMAKSAQFEVDNLGKPPEQMQGRRTHR
jgi:outer membrane protein assembly factor BamD (BamD/ComL family)